MTDRIEAKQMGRDSKGQPVIGIFKNDLLITQLNMEKVAQLYADSMPREIELTRPAEELPTYWIIERGNLFAISVQEPEFYRDTDLFNYPDGRIREFRTIKQVEAWLKAMAVKFGFSCRIVYPNMKSRKINEEGIIDEN